MLISGTTTFLMVNNQIDSRKRDIFAKKNTFFSIRDTCLVYMVFFAIKCLVEIFSFVEKKTVHGDENLPIFSTKCV